MLLQKLGDASNTLQLPTSKTESWKYTSLRALDKAAAKLQASALAHELDSNFALSTQPEAPLPNGGGALKTSGVFAELAATAAVFTHALSAQQYFYLCPKLANGIVQQAHRFTLAASARATLLWHHTGTLENTFSNFLTQITLAENAELTLIRMQLAAGSANLIERTEISAAAGAKINVVDINFGAQLSRHELHITLSGAEAHAQVVNLSVLNARQHCDTQLVLNHSAANTTSNTRVKAVADARARSVFNGRIYVAKGSDGTDAQLKTNNLLLSDAAEIDTKPELEIHAEDVKCSHGATIGQLDENALFYLRSRGIDATQARQILTVAFCQELLEAISDLALRAKLIALLTAKLPATNADSAVKESA